MLTSIDSGRHSSQRGITLLESLVSIVVLSLGVLGVLGVQLRTLADTQTGVRRAQAVRLIEDLSERIKVSPDGINNIGAYTAAWNVDITGAVANCVTTACTSAQLAAYDRNNWVNATRTLLPRGDANVFVVPDEAGAVAGRRQLGVMVSWRESEKSASKADGTADSTYSAATAVASTGGANVSCPAGTTCHLQYIQVTSRCSPYTLDGAATAPLFCP